jgi:hypothetical protein
MYKRGKGFFKNKKGQDELWEVLTMMAGAAVGIFFVLVIFRFSSTDRANLAFFTKDASILTDSILATPQNVELVYSNEYPGSYALYKGSEIQLFKDSNTSGESVYRNSFIPMRRIIMSTVASPLSVVYFLKNETFMTISTQPWTILKPQEQSVSQQEVGHPIPAEIAEQQRVQALYQTYLSAQNLCFRTLNECTKTITDNYAEPCKEFDCFCSSSSLQGIDTSPCVDSQPYFIMANNLPQGINK